MDLSTKLGWKIKKLKYKYRLGKIHRLSERVFKLALFAREFTDQELKNKTLEFKERLKKNH